MAHFVGYSVYLIWAFENIELDGSKRQDGQNFVMGSFGICIPRFEMLKDRIGETCRKHVRKSTKVLVRKRELIGICRCRCCEMNIGDVRLCGRQLDWFFSKSELALR
jgi:hypothetical protein